MKPFLKKTFTAALLLTSISASAGTGQIGSGNVDINEKLSLRAFSIAANLFNKADGLIVANGPEHQIIKKAVEAIVKSAPSITSYLEQDENQLNLNIMGEQDKNANANPLEGVVAYLKIQEKDFSIPVQYASEDFLKLQKLEAPLAACGLVNNGEVKKVSIEKLNSCGGSLYQELKSSGVQYISISMEPLKGNPNNFVTAKLSLTREVKQYIAPTGLIRTLGKQQSLSEIEFSIQNKWILERLNIPTTDDESPLVHAGGSSLMPTLGFSIYGAKGNINELNIAFKNVAGWGDCMAGCTAYHTWTGIVVVSKDNAEATIKEEGDALPKD